MKGTFTCSICGDEFESAHCYSFDDQDLCERCLEEETILCRSCGNRIWRDDNAGDDDIPLCQRCYEHHYSNCIRCGAVVGDGDTYYSEDDPDNEEPLCYSCYARLDRPRAIQDYYYKPEPIFYGDGLRFFGVELEIDGAGESSSSAIELMRIANQGHLHLYCKHDSSLDDGFELVSHPMTIDYHHRCVPWKEVIEKAVELGYRSHQAGTCGLHVHVNRSTFGETEEEQDQRIARILYFFERHWEELLKFSRRTEHQLKRWAARYGYKEQPMDILDHAKKGFGGGRYSCVNLQNRDTVEFRIFRGTLKYNTLIATVQLVDKLCEVAIALNDDQLKALSWTSFVSGIQEDRPELVRYLKERRLYVNEPVESEADL